MPKQRSGRDSGLPEGRLATNSGIDRVTLALQVCIRWALRYAGMCCSCRQTLGADSRARAPVKARRLGERPEQH